MTARRLFRRGLAVILEIVVLVGSPVLLLTKLLIMLDAVVVRLWEG